MTSSPGKFKSGLTYQSSKNSLSLNFTSVYMWPLNSLWDCSVVLILTGDTCVKDCFQSFSLDPPSLWRRTTEMIVGTDKAFESRIQNYFQPGEKKVQKREFLRHSLRVLHADKENSIVCSIFYVFIYVPD